MIGQKVSHYRILEKLGGGGMGVVYEAEDLRLGRHVALKFVPDKLIGDRKFLDRFEREARAASQLNHPNICTIHDIEDNDGHPFIVMEKLEGQSLKERLRSAPLDMNTLLDIAVQVADALAASHAKGILHRDIKPGNVFLTLNGQVKVLDFGLAKLLKNGIAAASEDTPVDDSLTAVGVIPGTAVYMSPEQARGEELDARSDLFSFGVMLYEMATGKKPFHGKNIITTLEAVMRQKPLSPRRVNPEIPAELESIIGKAMEKDRRHRYASAEAMKADLEHLKGSSGTSLAKTGRPRGVARDIKASRLANTTFQSSGWKQKYLFLGMAGLLLTVLAAVGTRWYRHRTASAGTGLSGESSETGTRPKDPKGYDLYLRSIAAPHDAAPNKDAIAMLEQAVALDPDYAPAWEALGQRYYYDATYSDGGQAMFQKSTSAYERALAVDPNRAFAASSLITNWVERGELVKAYQAAQALAKRRPDSAEAHLALGYVLRYLGELGQSEQECDAALRLDPGNYRLRSCAFTFMELGNTQRALDFARLDLGSEWSNWIAPAILLREGEAPEARERAKQMPPGNAYHRQFLQACLRSPQPANFDQIAKDTEVATLGEADPEAWYLEGSIMAFCRQRPAALHLLKAAVDRGYCSYSALMSDPLLEKLRRERGFEVLLNAARACQNAARNPPPQ